MFFIFSSSFATIIRLTLVAALMATVACAGPDVEQCLNNCGRQSRTASNPDCERKCYSCPSNGYTTAPPSVGIYKLYKTKYMREDAVMNCTAEGAHLAVPNDELELRVLVKLMTQYNLKKVYVGFTVRSYRFWASEGGKNTKSITEEQEELLNHIPTSKPTCVILSNGNLTSSDCYYYYPFFCEC